MLEWVPASMALLWLGRAWRRESAMNNMLKRTGPGEPDSGTPDQQFRAVVGELEWLIWHLVVRPLPPPEQIRVLEMGTLIEVLPQVYVQALRLAYGTPNDRYVRVYCIVPGSNGTEEERTLLCFHTPDFPDPNYAQQRLGMDLNLGWWQVLRDHLSALVAAQHGEPGTTQPEIRVAGASEDAPRIGSTSVWPGAAEIEQWSRQQDAPDSSASHMGAGQKPTPRAPGAAAQPEARQLEEQRRQMQLFFDEWMRLRQETYVQRDVLERSLRDAYFVVYPFMLPAAKVLSEREIGGKVMEWVQGGFPLPEDAPAQAQEESDTAPTAPAPQVERAIIEAHQLAERLEQVQVQVRERSRVLQRTCELLGGHQPREQRDVETGTVRMMCGRCGSWLDVRAPEQRDGWIN